MEFRKPLTRGARRLEEARRKSRSARNFDDLFDDWEERSRHPAKIGSAFSLTRHDREDLFGVDGRDRFDLD